MVEKETAMSSVDCGGAARVPICSHFITKGQTVVSTRPCEPGRVMRGPFVPGPCDGREQGVGRAATRTSGE
ncbi:hypothetical protein BCEN4_1100014 [Burkholderia cenocepacia]|nr:hypothetical protein BCEN4_1100014 [Burkholderia cenocepacia]